MKILTLCFFCFWVFVASAQFSSEEAKNESYYYEGTIGNSEVVLFFSTYYYDDTRVSGYHGSYYYKKIGQEIELSGVWSARNGKIEIAEFGTPQKTVSGYFELTYTDSVNLLTGNWYSFDKTRKLTVKLKLTKTEN